MASYVAEHLEDCRRCGLEAETYRAISEALAQRRRPLADALTRLQTFGQDLLRTPDDPGG